MKTKKLILLIAILVSIISTTKIYSQYDPPPCWMDCPNSIWKWEIITIRLGDICPSTPPECFNHNLEIQFWHRHAECPDFNPPYGMIDEYDCQIKSISYHENCHNMCLEQLNIIGLYNIALKKVYDWMVGEYGINPLDTAIWRAVNVSCWGKLTVDGKVIVEYCPNFSENCCWKKYKVTQVNNVNVFTLIAAYIPEGAPPNCAVDTKPCYYYCDMINLEEAPPEKRSIFGCGTDFVNVEYVNLFERMNQKYDGHSLNIFDVNGRLLSALKISSSTNQTSVDDLITGVYFYRVMDESNLIVENGKFIKY